MLGTGVSVLCCGFAPVPTEELHPAVDALVWRINATGFHSDAHIRHFAGSNEALGPFAISMHLHTFRDDHKTKRHALLLCSSMTDSVVVRVHVRAGQRGTMAPLPWIRRSAMFAV